MKQLLQVFDMPPSPDVMERRRQALLEFADTLQPQDPLWTIVSVRRPSTEVEYMAFLRRLCDRSGLRRNRLPRREDQLRALLVVVVKTNHGTVADLDDLLTLRAQLIASRSKADQATAPAAVAPAADGHTLHREHVPATVSGLLSEPAASACARCQHLRHPVELAGVASFLLVVLAMVAVVLIAVFQFVL